jgi:hypothetical protein
VGVGAGEVEPAGGDGQGYDVAGIEVGESGGQPAGMLVTGNP